jgi:di/tripeptidase
MEMDLKEKLYSYFTEFTAVDTQSDEKSETCPSTAGQLRWPASPNGK